MLKYLFMFGKMFVSMNMDFRTSTWVLPVWAVVEDKLGGLVTIS